VPGVLTSAQDSEPSAAAQDLVAQDLADQDLANQDVAAAGPEEVGRGATDGRRDRRRRTGAG
jgi:hypothetical protein